MRRQRRQQVVFGKADLHRQRRGNPGLAGVAGKVFGEQCRMRGHDPLDRASAINASLCSGQHRRGNVGGKNLVAENRVPALEFLAQHGNRIGFFAAGRGCRPDFQGLAALDRDPLRQVAFDKICPDVGGTKKRCVVGGHHVDEHRHLGRVLPDPVQVGLVVRQAERAQTGPQTPLQQHTFPGVHGDPGVLVHQRDQCRQRCGFERVDLWHAAGPGTRGAAAMDHRCHAFGDITHHRLLIRPRSRPRPC